MIANAMDEKAAQDLVDCFFNAVEARDFERMGQCLSPEKFSYVSPIETFDNADDFVARASRVGPITKRIERRKLFVDGNEVCVIYNFITTMDTLAVTRTAQWMKIESGKIVSIE
jgi:hypothetical protein